MSDQRIVNVATVPMRSPFRYPGGKTWLVPIIRQWLAAERGLHLTELIDPFAGGAIVSLTAVFEGLVPRATLVELDDGVSAVWTTILNGHADWLAGKIAAFEMTHENLRPALAEANRDIDHLAFATILRNRANRGGIMAPGAGLIKHGENGKGLSSRWYPRTLCERIHEIARRRERLAIIHGDGIGYVAANAGRTDVAYFIDPPYTVAGRRLYNHSELDHAALFEVASGLKGEFLITYDAAEEIAQLAVKHGLETALVPMRSTHHTEKRELLVGRDLGWLER